MFEDFIELHGDRNYGDDPAIMGGISKFNGRSVVIIGHQKGADAKEMAYRKFRDAPPGRISKGLEVDEIGGGV